MSIVAVMNFTPYRFSYYMGLGLGSGSGPDYHTRTLPTPDWVICEVQTDMVVHVSCPAPFHARGEKGAGYETMTLHVAWLQARPPHYACTLAIQCTCILLVYSCTIKTCRF